MIDADGAHQYLHDVCNCKETCTETSYNVQTTSFNFPNRLYAEDFYGDRNGTLSIFYNMFIHYSLCFSLTYFGLQWLTSG